MRDCKDCMYFSKREFSYQGKEPMRYNVCTAYPNEKNHTLYRKGEILISGNDHPAWCIYNEYKRYVK